MGPLLLSHGSASSKVGVEFKLELDTGQRLSCASPLAVSRGYSPGSRYYEASLPCLLSVVSSSCFAPALT